MLQDALLPVKLVDRKGTPEASISLLLHEAARLQLQEQTILLRGITQGLRLPRTAAAEVSKLRCPAP